MGAAMSDPMRRELPRDQIIAAIHRLARTLPSSTPRTVQDWLTVGLLREVAELLTDETAAEACHHLANLIAGDDT